MAYDGYNAILSPDVSEKHPIASCKRAYSCLLTYLRTYVGSMLGSGIVYVLPAPPFFLGSRLYPAGAIKLYHGDTVC